MMLVSLDAKVDLDVEEDMLILAGMLLLVKVVDVLISLL